MKEEKIATVCIDGKKIADLTESINVDKPIMSWSGSGSGYFGRQNAMVIYYCRRGNKFFFRYPYGIITAELHDEDLSWWLEQKIKYGTEFETNIKE